MTPGSGRTRPGSKSRTVVAEMLYQLKHFHDATSCLGQNGQGHFGTCVVTRSSPTDERQKRSPEMLHFQRILLGRSGRDTPFQFFL